MRVDNTDSPLSQTIAGEVRAEMARQKISGVALARQLGMTQPYLSRRLTGEVDFRVGELDRVAQVLGVPVSKFLPVVPVRAS